MAISSLRKTSGLALALALTAGCGHQTPAATRQAAGVPMTLDAARHLDRDDLIALSAHVLAESDKAGEKDVVAGFVAYADGPDPDPAATREIARQALAGRMTTASPTLARIATGGAHPTKLAARTGIRFPLDEGAHAMAITEWWYLNGHLQTADGATYGYEFTLFKIGPLLHWAHVAVTDANGQHFSYGREWIPVRQALAAPDHLAIDYAGQAIAHLADGRYGLGATADTHQLALTLTSRKAPLLIDGNGKIDMPEGMDSWYYSLTRLDTTGTLDGKPVTGLGWMDHQWGPFWVSGFKDRWDWFSLQFDDQTEYNLFGFRSASGEAGARHANESLPTGAGSASPEFTMDRLAWWQSPRSGLYYTTKWTVGLPASHESVALEATNVDQELFRRTSFLADPLPIYWEGNMRAVKTTADGRQVPGVAYCEHFGFPTPNGPH